MKSVIYILVTASALCCRAQHSKTDPTMVKFFAGNWSCTGEFASGKKIEADAAHDRLEQRHHRGKLGRGDLRERDVGRPLRPDEQRKLGH